MGYDLFMGFNEMNVAKLYRFETYRTSETGRGLTVVEFPIIGETPQGWWIKDDYGLKKRWVSKTAKKRYAYPTREEAMESFKARKAAFIKHARNMLRVAEIDLGIADGILREDFKQYLDYFKVEVGAVDDILVKYIDPVLHWRRIRIERSFSALEFRDSLFGVLYGTEPDPSFWDKPKVESYY